MPKTFTATVTIEINAGAAEVWKALTDPAIVKQYFFGTNLVTDWKKGSPIYFRGEWDGKPYEDKGTILDIEPERFVTYNYWSSMSGTPDIPENYATIKYELTRKETKTELSIVQDGIASEEQQKHSEENWRLVMGGMKKLTEGS